MNRCVQNHERTRSNKNRPLRYVPPALCGEYRTSWRSQLNQTSTSKDWRDPPPHKDLPESPPKCLDSLDWCVPSPNCPVSFKNPSPPPSPLPQSPTPSASPLHPPPTVQIPPQHHTQSRLTSELIGIIKTTSETLQGIVQISEKLIQQVNTGRQLAHRPQKHRRSLCVDMLGNVVCSLPPTFPSPRGESVTRSPGASDPLA